MDTLLAAHAKIKKQGGLQSTVNDVDNVLKALQAARDAIAIDGTDASLTLTKAKSTVKQCFESLDQNVKSTHNALSNYSKALDKKLRNVNLPAASNDPFSARPDLTNRAIAMHFLREGQFSIASSFIAEATDSFHAKPQPQNDAIDMDLALTDWSHELIGPLTDAMNGSDAATTDASIEQSADLYAKFVNMYQILRALKHDGDLEPAIAWARANREVLNLRGSDLEFELCRLRFIELYTGTCGDTDKGTFVNNDEDRLLRSITALDYARATFPDMPNRYLRQTSTLLASLAYAPSLQTSPYRALYYNSDVWSDVTHSFVREFCGLLGLSEKSPLYTAVTAGGIALPVLEKLERLMGQVGGQWTSANELPVAIALPPAFQFHSIFVCPVSKEQATDSNPPMMLPCCHVIAKESLEKISRGSKRFKCPYCPNESTPSDAKTVYL